MTKYIKIKINEEYKLISKLKNDLTEYKFEIIKTSTKNINENKILIEQ
jgi:hypothetical protein